VRRRFAALLEPARPDDPAPAPSADDIRRCGGLIVRLGGEATATVIATRMGWTLEKAAASVAEVDHRLGRVGLQLVAGGDGRLAIHERVRHRIRPQRPSIELQERLDDPGCRHGLAHLVRGDSCEAEDDWVQPLFDLGVAVPGRYPGAEPCEASAQASAAFAGGSRTPSTRSSEPRSTMAEASPLIVAPKHLRQP